MPPTHPRLLCESVTSAPKTPAPHTTPNPTPCHTQMREQQLLELDALCRSKGVKLLIVRSYGLMGYMRVSCTATVLPLYLPRSCFALALYLLYACVCTHAVLPLYSHSMLPSLVLAHRHCHDTMRAWGNTFRVTNLGWHGPYSLGLCREGVAVRGSTTPG